jgi:cyclin-dependent kinase 6
LYDVRTNTAEVNGHIRETFTFVLEYIDRDLEVYLQGCPADGLQEPVIKDLMHQLLSGVATVHNTGMIHRDIKPQNILVSQSGQLKISDFGLARLYRPGTALTTEVVTQWYRAPEVLLMANYTRAIDIWSVGCIFVQLYTLRPLFPGQSERQQLDLIFEVLSTPKQEDWPEGSCIQWKSFEHYDGIPWDRIVKHASPEAYQLIESLLRFRDADRPMANEALQHPYFIGRVEGEVPPSNMVAEDSPDRLVGEIPPGRLVGVPPPSAVVEDVPLESSLDSGIGPSEVNEEVVHEGGGGDSGDCVDGDSVDGDTCEYSSETTNEDSELDSDFSESSSDHHDNTLGTPPSKRTKFHCSSNSRFSPNCSVNL